MESRAPTHSDGAHALIPAAAAPPSLTICTFGDLLLDVIVLPDVALAPDADTPAAIRVTAGGQAANVAAWAAALGARSRLVCKRGADPSSRLAAEQLAGHGVEICGPVPDGRGGVVVSVRNTHGERTMASDRGVASELRRGELDPAWLSECDVLHISGYCLLSEPMADAAAAAAQLVRSVSVDLASAHDIARVGAETFRARLAALHPQVIFATEDERARLPDIDAPWVVKLGARGARFPEGERAALAGALVDTTGAGDALAAGYLVGGPDLAMRAAARCVGLIGAMPA